MEEDDKKEQVAKAASERKRQADLAKEIKAMEAKKREEALKQAPPPAAEQKMHFDGWYALRGGSIPAQHMKEILRADFKARGCSDMETLQRYDAALIQYGVKAK